MRGSFASTSRTRLVLVGVVGGIALLAAFAGGVLAANATLGAGESPLTDGGDSQAGGGKPDVPLVPAGKNGEGTSATPPSGASRADVGFPGSTMISEFWPSGCPAPLEGVLNGGKVDPALGGFPAKLLGEGFQFAGLAIRAERDCATAESPPRTVLETTWIHQASGQAVHVTQTPDEGGRPNVILIGSADFAKDGYRFGVFAGFNPSIQQGGMMATAAIGGAPPSSQAAIEEAVNQLAGGVDQSCSYRQRQGTWDDAMARGIADPRGLIPAGLKEVQAQIMLFDPPAASCQAPALEGIAELTLQAIYGDEKGMLNIGVSSLGREGVAATGRFGNGSAYWSNTRYQFHMNWHPGSLSEETARAIAARLDPSFGTVCLVEVRPMSEDEARVQGVVAPTAPEGFRLEKAANSMVLVAGNGNCDVSGGEQGFRANWMLFGEPARGLIVVEASKGPQEPGRPVAEYYDPARSLFWVDGKGVSHAVSGLKAEVPRETLIAVAKSVDPAFDETRLTTPQGSGVPEPK